MIMPLRISSAPSASGSRASPCMDLDSKFSLIKDLMHLNLHLCVILSLAKAAQWRVGERCFKVLVLGKGSSFSLEQLVLQASIVLGMPGEESLCPPVSKHFGLCSGLKGLYLDQHFFNNFSETCLSGVTQQRKFLRKVREQCKFF